MSTGSEQDQQVDEVKDNLTILEETLPEDSFARKLLNACRIEEGDALENVVAERLEELRQAYAETMPQED